MVPPAFPHAPGGGTAAAGCLAYAAATLIFSLILLKPRSCRLEETVRNAYFPRFIVSVKEGGVPYRLRTGVAPVREPRSCMRPARRGSIFCTGSGLLGNPEHRYDPNQLGHHQRNPEQWTLIQMTRSIPSQKLH